MKFLNANKLRRKSGEWGTQHLLPALTTTASAGSDEIASHDSPQELARKPTIPRVVSLRKNLEKKRCRWPS